MLAKARRRAHVGRLAEALTDRLAEVTGVDSARMFGRDRHRHVARSRMVAVWATRRATGASYPQLGEVWGRDHSTMVHAVQVVDAALEAGERWAVDLVDALGDVEAIGAAHR